MACIYNNSTISNFNSTFINKSIDKSSLSPAMSVLKLMKTVRKIFNNSSSNTKKSNIITKQMISGPVVISTCMTEEEHQNWLNEQFESTAIQF
ncbi:hypothetical protein FF38_11162 [Lucilia cuprina]|uniref:Uncharacterized protein n=1 Tax=Lucilia cuprina TaxID=7375 RepID=A0A0L0BVX3_LUCCU|nr:uncharacterized protein LOC111682614 [Lucilia cuprina]KAI8123520.1 hypothetical protein CVS40_5917 [Lucilia cuprina]KNC24163.1 hypothetical protein FF38_11162 [Lucilia cuprina]